MSDNNITSSAPSTPFAEISQEVEQAAVRPLLGAASPEPALSGTGFSYRHNWGSRRGNLKLNLNWGAITARSHVFVSISEGAAGDPNGKFIGAAKYTLHNVAPHARGVNIWVNIEWSRNIPLYVDYLVVNPPGDRTVRVTVHRHSTVALTNAEADRILRDMGSVLQDSNSASDIETAVRFVRNGSVRVLPPHVAGTIQTRAQLRTLLSAGTGVKVVQAIRFCSGPGGSIIGCAPIGSSTVNLAVVRFTPNQEGILWVHEYGHNVGLNHRSDDRRAVMYPSIGSDNNVVNSTESGRYLSGPQAVTNAAMALACCGEEAMQPPKDIWEFVSQHWIEGVPYQAASQYTEDDAKRLLEWLVEESEEQEEFLPEIVTTLCFIGSDVAVKPLIDFVEGSRTSRPVFNARNAALIHLGDLINKSGNQAALDFLTRVAMNMESARALAEPHASVAAAEVGVVTPTIEDLGAELAVSATFGLALAGTLDAEKTISLLKDSPDAFASVNQAATEAAGISQTVRAQGQEKYYKMKSVEHSKATPD